MDPRVLQGASNEIVKRIVHEEVATKIRAEQRRRSSTALRFEQRLHTFV